MSDVCNLGAACIYIHYPIYKSRCILEACFQHLFTVNCWFLRIFSIHFKNSCFTTTSVNVITTLKKTIHFKITCMHFHLFSPCGGFCNNPSTLMAEKSLLSAQPPALANGISHSLQMHSFIMHTDIYIHKTILLPTAHEGYIDSRGPWNICREFLGFTNCIAMCC